MTEHFVALTQSFDNASLRKSVEWRAISLVASDISDISEIRVISVKKKKALLNRFFVDVTVCV